MDIYFVDLNEFNKISIFKLKNMAILRVGKFTTAIYLTKCSSNIDSDCLVY